MLIAENEEKFREKLRSVFNFYYRLNFKVSIVEIPIIGMD